MTNLTGVSETLLLTLYLRNLETKRLDGIINDTKAVEIVESLDVDLAKFDDNLTQLAVAIRTEIIDVQTQAFLAQNPEATVINLAAGLCTRFFRIDDGKVKWYAIDLEAVKPLWEKYIGATDRRKYFAYSALDFAWMDLFEDIKHEKILFIIEGLSMYLSEAEMKQLIIGIKNNFPSSEVLIDAISPAFLQKTDKFNLALSQTTASFTWGIENFTEMESWDKNIKIIEQWFYADRHINRWQSFDFFNNSSFRPSGKVGKLHFN